MNKTIAYHPPTDAQTVPKHQQPSQPAPQVLFFSTMPYGMGYAFGQFGLILFFSQIQNTASYQSL